MATSKPFSYEEANQAQGSEGFSYEEAAPRPKAGPIRRIADMTAVPLAQGVVGVPEALVGLADIATGGRAGKAAESLGFRPREAKQIIGDALYSDEQKAANEAVARADGFLPTLGAMVENPSTIVRTVAESVPSMFAGGAISRIARGVAPALNPIAAGAAGEGAIMAGQAAANIRQESPDGLLSAPQAAAAAGTGVAGGIISRISGGLANRMGLGDIETAMAAGRAGPVGEQAAQAAARKGLLRRAGEGVVTEGALEEMPQSMAEQVLQNVALGKPWDEGVGSAAAAGLLTGAAMGGVVAPMRGRAQPGPQDQPPPAQDTPPAGPPLLGYDPNADRMIVFPDGTVARRSEIDNLITSTNEEDRPALVAKLFGYGAQPAGLSTSAGAAPRGPSAAAGMAPLEPQAPDFSTSPGAAPMRDGLPFTRDFDTGGLSLVDPQEQELQRAATVDFEPPDTTPQWPTAPGAAAPREGLELPPPEFDTGTLALGNGPISRATRLALPAPGTVPPGEPLQVDPQGNAGTGAQQDLRRREAAPAGPAPTGDWRNAARPGAGPISRAAGFVPQDVPAQPSTGAAAAGAGTQAAGAGAGNVPAASASAAAPLEPGDFVVDDHFAGAHRAATSPLNGRKEPSDAQKEAENYPVGRTRVAGMAVSIENPQGSTRRGTDPSGKPWETLMQAHYGRLPGTKAADSTKAKKQQLDAFIKPGTAKDYAGPVFVVDQVDPATGKFDEHKVIFGATDEADAERIYRSNYAPDWNGLGSVNRMPVGAFKAWAYDGKRKAQPLGDITGWKPAAGAAPAAPATPAAPAAPAAPAPAPAPVEPAPTQDEGPVGRDGTPLASGGKPFKTKLGALQFKKDHRPQARVVTVPGGFALRDPTERQQQAGQDAGRRRLAAARAASYEKNPFLTFLADQGLYHEKDKPRSQKQEFSPDRFIMVAGYGPVFRRDGKLPDALLQPAIEAGYLPPGATEQQLEDMIRRAVAGQRVAPLYAEGSAEAEIERRMAEREEPPPEEPPAWVEGLTDEDLEDAGFDQLDAEQQARLQELLQQAEAAGVDAEMILETVAKNTENATEQDYHEAARQALEAAIAGTRGAGAPGGEQAAGQEGAEAGGQPQPDPDEVAAAPAPREQDLLGDAPSATQQAAAAARAELDEREQRQRDAAPEPGDFTLTGSDRPADEAAARGQGGLFDRAAAAPAPSEAPAPQPQQAPPPADPEEKAAELPGEPPGDPTEPPTDAAREPEQPYTHDLFGNPLPPPKTAAPKRPGAAAQRETAVKAEGEFYVDTVLVQAGERELGADRITSAADLARATHYLYRSAVERFDAIVTDANGKPLGVVGGFKGATAEAAVYPSVILAEAIRIPGAKRIWLSHNHPSGNSQLSQADMRLAQVIERTFRGSGIDVMGIMAVSRQTYSFMPLDANQQDAQESTTRIEAPAARVKVPVFERELRDERQLPRQINSVQDARELARNMVARGGPGIMLLDAQNALAGWLPLTGLTGRLLPSGRMGMLMRAASRSNARAAIIAHRGELEERIDATGPQVQRNLINALTQLDIRVLDAIDVKIGRSAVETGTLESGGGEVYALDEPMQDRMDERMPSGLTMREVRDRIATLRGPMTLAQAQAAVDRITAGWNGGFEIRVVASSADLPGRRGNARGRYINGVGYIVADKHRTLQDIGRTLAHEVIQHHGMRALLGKPDWKRLMQQIQAAARAGNKEVLAAQELVRRLYRNADGSYMFDGRPELESDEIAARIIEASVNEQGDMKPSLQWLKWVWAKLAQALRGLGLKVPFTTAELHGIFVASRRNLERAGGRSAPGAAIAPAAAAQDSVSPPTDMARKAAVLQGPPVADLPTPQAPRGFAALRQWATELFEKAGGQSVNPELGAVVLNEKAVRDSLGHSMNRFKAEAFAAVPAVVAKGVVVHTARKRDVDAYWISAPVRIQGQDDVMTVLVRRDANTQRMYLHAVATKENLLNPRVSRAPAAAGELTGSSSSADVASVLRQLLEFKLDQPPALDARAGQAAQPNGSGDPADLDELLAQVGEPIVDRMDALRRWNDGQRIFAMHEQAETASEVRTREELDAYTPDQLIALPEEGMDARDLDIAGDTGRAYTPDQLAAMQRVGFATRPEPLAERAKRLWGSSGKILAQGIVDQFAPVKEISREAYGLLRLSKGASGAFEVLLQGGQLKLTDGVYDFDAAKRGGVVDRLLKPLQGEHHDFLRWVAANRAEQLAAEDREHLFTPADIAALKTLATGQLASDFTLRHGPRAGQTTRSRAEAYRDSLATFNEFNKNTLDMAQQSGLIDGASRSLWERAFYVPFYRVMEDGGLRGMNIKNGVVRQQAFKQLKGGTQQLNADLLENTLMNWAHLLDAAAKNRGAKATLEAMANLGAAVEADEATARQMAKSIGRPDGVVWFMDQGRKRHYLVDDPYLMTALTSLEFAGMRSPVMDALSTFKRYLTIGVTASPFFKVRNLIRDSIQAIGTAPLGANPLQNVASGWRATAPGSEQYFRLLAGGGTIHFGTMLEGSEAKRVQALVEAGVDQATILDSGAKVKAFYRKVVEPAIAAYNELGNRGEAVNRAALYQQLRAQGMSHAEASLQARDLMDFSMQGSFTSVRFLTQVVPFMNARLQGLYKLGRGAAEDPARFSAVLGAAAVVSIGLLAAYGDDDDWKKREDWDRNNYWWFKVGGVAYRIPKPFEIGAIATLAERTFELAFSEEMTGERFRQQIRAVLGDSLAMNPIPQLVKPILDVYSNVDSFTKRPIETMGMERLQPQYRFTERTTMAARGASAALNAVSGLAGMEGPSPVQIDHLVRGYFGWLGALIVGAGDVVARPLTDQPARPQPDYWRTLTGAMVSTLEDAPSRYVSATYQQAKELEQIYGTWRHLIRQGQVQEAQAFRDEYAQELVRYRQVEAVRRAMTQLNALRRQVESGEGTPGEKRERIRQINEQQDALARRLAPG